MKTEMEKAQEAVDIRLSWREKSPELPKPRHLSVMAQEAIDIQNACNIRGISKSFAKIVDEVAEWIEQDRKNCIVSLTRYENVRSHPIVQLWASKIHDMAGMGISYGPAFSAAYDECRRWARCQGRDPWRGDGSPGQASRDQLHSPDVD